MARKSSRPSQFERAYRLLEYLRENTDREHPITQAELRGNPETHSYMGRKETGRDLIIRMVLAMNYAEYGLRPKDQWKLNFDAFEAKYGRDNEEEDGDEEEGLDDLQIRRLYYQHTFSKEEIDRLIEAFLFSSTLTGQEAKALIDKIETHLTTRFYPKDLKKVCRVREPRMVEPARLRESLLTIQQAIDSHVKISFVFNAYRRDKQLHPVRKKGRVPFRDTVSPYYIVANGGRYYLLACRDNYSNMSIWRIDLMTDIEISGGGRESIRPEDRARDKKNVRDLPQVWDEEFHHTHLNMSYEQPRHIRLRIWPSQSEQEINYTFLHDWFGDSFRYIRTEESGDDVVEVQCSPYAMVNFAMQYSDRFEGLEPKEVREGVIKRLQEACQRYNLKKEN